MRWWLKPGAFNDAQRRMFSAAGRHLGFKVSLWVGLLIAVLCAFILSRQSLERGHRQRVQNKEAEIFMMATLPDAIEQLKGFNLSKTICGKHCENSGQSCIVRAVEVSRSLCFSDSPKWPAACRAASFSVGKLSQSVRAGRSLALPHATFRTEDRARRSSQTLSAASRFRPVGATALGGPACSRRSPSH